MLDEAHQSNADGNAEVTVSESNGRGNAEIPVGSVLPSPAEGQLAIWTDDADLRPHADRAWLRAYANASLGADVPAPKVKNVGKEASVPDEALRRHSCVFGSAGSGKSRLTLHLIAEQMKQGCSVLALDPKSKTIEYLIACAREAGVPQERTVVLDPAAHDVGPPGWNPLQIDIPAAQAAVALVSILKQSNDSWGPRLGDILTSALILLSAHGLTLYELPRFLTRADYRDGLLRLPRPSRGCLAGGQAAFTEAWEFFAREFSVWAPGDRTAAISPVLTRTRTLLGSDFFQALLCARRNTLDLASLWQKQGAVFVHLDDGTLGDDGAQLLGGLLAHHLYLTAMRAPGPVPVILALDELGKQEKFVGAALLKIAMVARQQNLRLLVATQHLGSLSPELRDALLTSSQFQAFFQLGHDDAALVARRLVPDAAEPLRRVTARVASRDHASGQAARSSWRHEILGSRGQSLRLDATTWLEFRREQMLAAPGEEYSLRRLQELAEVSGVPRLYVRAADTGDFVALAKYLAGLPETEYWFEGPAPLELVVSFPTPQFVHPQKRSHSDLVARWTGVLDKLPERHAALSVWHGDPDLVRIADVSVPEGSSSDEEWSRSVRYANSQTWNEIEGTRTWRAEEIERIASGAAPLAAKASSATGQGEGSPVRLPQQPLGPRHSESPQTEHKKTEQPAKAVQGSLAEGSLAEGSPIGVAGLSGTGGIPPETYPVAIPAALAEEVVADDGSLS